jgi:hypothetical protein
MVGLIGFRKRNNKSQCSNLMPMDLDLYAMCTIILFLTVMTTIAKRTVAMT